jgi:hypothetical protein
MQHHTCNPGATAAPAASDHTLLQKASQQENQQPGHAWSHSIANKQTHSYLEKARN